MYIHYAISSVEMFQFLDIFCISADFRISPKTLFEFFVFTLCVVLAYEFSIREYKIILKIIK